MQNQITYSSERIPHIKISDVDAVHAAKYTEKAIISSFSCSYSQSSPKFSALALCENTSNNIDVGVLSAPYDSIINFRIYEDYIFFCGTHKDTINAPAIGYIGFTHIGNIYTGGTYERHQIVNTTAIYDLEVYPNPINGRPKIAALGKMTSNNYCIVDYDILDNNINTYTTYKTTSVLYRIAQTKQFVAIVYSLPTSLHEFGVTRHNKGNISSYIDQSYKYNYGGIQFGYSSPLANFPTFLIESDYFGEKVYVSTVIQRQTRPDISGTECSIGIYNIDLNNHLNLDFTQIIPTTSKTFIRDMKFADNNNMLYLIADPYMSGSPFRDIILDMNMSVVNNYTCMATAPTINTNYQHTLNSLVLYDKKYYMVAGGTPTDSLYWFDKYTPTIGHHCYKVLPVDVYFDPPIPNYPLTNYSPDTYYKNYDIDYLMHFSTQDSIVCIE